MKRILLLLVLLAPLQGQRETDTSLRLSAPAEGTDNVVYVGRGTPWPGTDIGAQINTVYAALPESGGKIAITPQVNGACYNFSTPIQFKTVGKYVILSGEGTGANNAVSDLQACLNYTPTTSTSAITIDWTPPTGGGYEAGAGIRDLVLINNRCFKPGGCGSSAIGVNIGTSNGGAHKALFENFKVQGFGSGYKFSNGDSNGLGWGVVWMNSPVVWNATGINYTVPHEQDTYIGGAINSNGIGVNLGAAAFGGEFTVIASSFDANLTCGIAMSNGQTVNIQGTHWENTSSGQPAYVCGGGTKSSKLNINGGIAYDLVRSGTTIQNWFVAGLMEVNGMQLVSFGRTSTKSIFVANTRGSFSALPVPVANLPIISNNTENISFNAAPGVSPAANLPSAAVHGMLDYSETMPPSGLEGAERCYGDSKAHVLKCNYNNAGFFPMLQLGGNGASAGAMRLSRGAGSHTFIKPYLNPPICTATDMTATNPVQVDSSETTLTLSGTNADMISWICIPAAN